jgi:uncharacterized repeat protein (TIGR02543 family)
MEKTWIKRISLSLACLLGFGVLATTFAVASKKNAPVKVDAATTTTATLTYSDVLAHARSDYKKTEWGDWQWWKVIKSSGDIVAGDNTYFVNNKAYTDGATKIDFSISFKDGYVIPRIEMVAVTLARNSNSFSWTIEDDYYNQNPPYKVYFEDTTSGERHAIESMTLTYTFTKYTVSLNSNGGTGGLSSVKVPYNRAMPTISSSNLPTRNGYVFQGYYDTSADTGGNQYYKANGTSARTFTNKNDSLKLYARWALAQKPVNITKGTGLSNVYVSSNGNVTDASSSDLKSSGTNFAQNSTVYGYVKLAAGYQAQSGWTLKAGTADTAGALYLVGSGTVSSSGYDFGTFNASTITYSIDYELNGGSIATANPTSYTIESDTFTLNNPTKEGYNFLGWSEEGKSGYTETVTITKGTYGNKKYTANWALVEELQAVVDAINDLGGPTNISYPGSKTGLESAESLYSALDPTLKSILDTDYADLVNELIEDRNQYDSLRSAAINNAIDKIDAISEPISYPRSRDEVFAARDALADLDELDRVDTVVTNLSDYNDALDTYNALRDIAVDQVIEAINNISRDGEGKILYPNSKPSLENAESLYDALAEEEKTPTVVTNYNDLLQARSDYNALREDRVQDVIDAIDDISKPFDDNREEQIATAQGLFDALDSSDKDSSVITNLNKLEDAHAADDVADAIEVLPTVSDTDEYRVLVNETRDAYDSLTSDQKGFIGEDILELLVSREQALLVIDAINNIGDLSYPGSKDLLDVANDLYAEYIAAGYPAEFIVNYQTLVDDNTNYNNADAVAALIKAIPAPSESDAYYDAVDTAKAAYDALATAEQALLESAIFDNETGITYAQYLADQVAARDVIERIQNIGQVVYSGEDDSLEAIVYAETGYNALSDAQKAIVDGVNHNTLTKDRADYDAVDAVATLIELIPEAEASSDYYNAVDSAAAGYAQLTADQLAIINAATALDYEKVLADNVAARAVIEEIANIGTVTYDGGVNDSLAKIVSAETNYGNLSDDQKEIVNSANYSTLTDDRAVYDNVSAVADLIKAIPAVAESEEYYDAVDTAIAAFNLLSVEEQNVLKSSIFDSETGITYYQYLFNHVAARDVIERIQNIGQVVYGGEDDSLEAIVYAETGYNSLSDAQKAIVDGVNHNTLTKDRVDYDAVDSVATLIELIPDAEASEEYYNAVDSAAAGYAQLSDDQLAIINAATALDYEKVLADNVAAKEVIELIGKIGSLTYDGGINDSLSDIVAAETAYDAIKDNADVKAIVDSVNHQTLVDDRTIYDHADSVAKLIEAIPAPAEDQDYYDAVDAARSAYAAITEAEKQLLIEAIFDPAINMTYAEYLYNQGLARDVIETIENIGELTYDGGVNDSLADIVAAETAYDAIKDNEYVKAIVDSVNHQTLVDDRTIYDHADEVAKLIEAIPAPAEDQDYYDAVDAARSAYAALTEAEKQLLKDAIYDPATNMTYAEYLFNQGLARDVIETIENIGELTYDGGVNDSLADIVAAETAYDAIKDNEYVKAIVDSVNHQTLVDDRESYNAVDHTVSLIEEIGEIKHDEETKQDLEEAWEAYNSLSTEEQALVQGYNNTYKTLDDDQHVYDALVLIDDIGTVSYDSESEEKINQAREYYDSLTEDQKEQLGEEPLVVLVNSETEYARLEKNANILVIILLIVVCLTIIGGIWFLFFLLKKKRKDDDDDENKNNGKGKPVKAMSIGGFLPGVTLISHYLDAPYIALYVLAGVTVLLWISILVVVIMKKKQVGPFKKKEVVSKVEPQASVSSSEDEEVETISDEKGNIFQIRYIKSFTAKLIQSPEETKKYYEELKNEVLSYKKTNSRVSWHYDAVNSGRNYVLKFAIRGKTLCVYLPLDSESLEEKYKVERSESKRFEDVPCLYRIKNDRRCEYAKELIALVASNLGLEKGEEQHEAYSNLPYEPNKPLVARGLIKEQKVQVNKPSEQQVLETKVSSDGDEIVVTKDEKGNIFEIRYIKSFTAKLSQSEKDVKDYYTVLKNYALSYKDAHSRVSWHYDAINVGRDYVIKFAIRGKTLCAYFALDTSKLDEKYKVEEAKGKKFEEVPVLYRIKNDRRCEYAKELIDEVMKKVGADQGEVPTENYSIPHQSNKALLAKGLIKELKTAVKKKETHHIEHLVTSISVEEADKLMSDEDAEVMIEVDKSSKTHVGKKAIVNIDELEASFNNGDKVTLETLQEKKLVAKDVGRVKLLARGQLDKKLDVHLQEYSIQAVKMILLVGGKVQKAK